jgi:hypothetical protein
MQEESRLLPHTRCAELAAQQHGAISASQALAQGMSRHAISRCLITKRWRTTLPGIYIVGGAPATWKQRIFAAWLWAGPGAVVSHRAAAIILGLPGVRAAPIELTLPTSKKAKRPGLTLHRSKIGAHDREVRDGLAVTNGTRTIIDLAGYLGREQLRVALEDAIRRKLTSAVQLRWRLAQADMRSRKGSRVLRELLDEHSDQPATESVLEDRFEAVLRRHKIPLPERQYEIYDGDRFVARVDFAYPALRLAYEVEGFEYHYGRKKWVRDRRRHNSLRGLDWDLRYITMEMIDEGRSLAQEVAKELGLTLF